jgi:hypothetical protein
MKGKKPAEKQEMGRYALLDPVRNIRKHLDCAQSPKK